MIAPGYKADFNLIDYDGLQLAPPEMSYDLPAGGKRLVQEGADLPDDDQLRRGDVRGRRSHGRDARGG